MTFNLLYSLNYGIPCNAFLVVRENDSLIYGVPQSEAFFTDVRRRAKQYRDIGAAAADRVVALSTCSYEFKGARMVLLGKYCKKEVSPMERNNMHPPRRRPKSLMSIKEFSEMSGLEQSTLRYWDDIGLFRPALRDAGNSYRYYSPDQILLVNFIKVLSNLNIPLKTIAEISENRTPETILHLMEQQETILDDQLNRLQESYSTIHTLRDIIKQGICAPLPGTILVQNLDAACIELGPPNDLRENDSFYQSFARYCRYAKENRINLNNPIGGYYDSMERLLCASAVPSRFFSVSPRANSERPAGKYLIGYARGHYGELGGVPQGMMDYACEHKLGLLGPVYVFYLLGEISVREPSDYLAQICAAV